MVAKWTNETRKASALKPYDKNAKQHPPEQIEQIAASIREFGFGPPVAIDEKDMILAGHGRIAAVLLPGMEAFARSVPVRVGKGLTADQKRAFVLADNKIGENGEWDQTLLRGELFALDAAGFDVTLTGFDLADFAGAPAADPDEVPDPPKNPVTRRGDVWLCGGHRIMNGDSTSAEDVAKLLAGARPNLMVTDPPYGVEYDANWRNERVRTNGAPIGGRAIGKVSNDDEADWRDAYALFPGDVAYAWSADLRSKEAIEGLEASGFQIRAQIIWAKQQFAIGRGHYHFQHEPCWYGVRKGRASGWSGGRAQTTLWDIDKPHKSETGHSTQKPVECMARPMRNHGKNGDAVYDPFLGSGTSVIAAEQERRVCLGMELEPTYVDVGVLRWQAFTKKAATLEGDGRTFEDVAKARKRQLPK